MDEQTQGRADMTGLKWYKRYPADILAKTLTYTAEEYGAYNFLLDHYYLEGPGIDADPASLRKITRLSAYKFPILWKKISKKFTEKDGKLYHSRADRVISEAIDKSEKAAASARARWDADAMRPDMRTQCSLEPDTRLSNNNNKKKAGKKPAKKPHPFWSTENLESEFAAFKKMRRSIKAPLNEVAETRLIAKLEKMKADGVDIREAMNHSIENCWKGVFPPKRNHTGKQTNAERVRQSRDEYIASLDG